MIIKRSRELLQYEKLIEMIAEECTSSPGRRLAQKIEPSLHVDEAERLLAQAGTALSILTTLGGFPLGGFCDLHDVFQRLRLDAQLSLSELVSVYDVILLSGRLEKFFREHGPYAEFTEIVQFIIQFTQIEKEFTKAINEHGQIADNASPKLADIRRKLRQAEQAVQEKLASIVNSAEHAKHLQDNIVTIREGRFVVPVRAEYKNSVRGIIHDQSASGMTVYIEPMPVVELNNRIRQLQLDERDEIERILAMLTALVKADLTELMDSHASIAQLDVIQAKARFAIKQRAIHPVLSDSGEVLIRNGRHPLLGKDAVPVSIELGKVTQGLIITGPNTGGKTVTLKMVGLFCLMAACGIFVPAEEGTVLTIFSQVFADIGDEQSIEQSLSTFSSHMRNIVEICQLTDEFSLVLLDELGAGTDPTEGAALAMAIIDYLLGKKARLIATTHYSELKIYAHTNPLIDNASMEFDIESLCPTYRLLMGLPGKSNAFEISARLGLSHEIIQQARGRLSSNDLKIEDLIRDVEVSRRKTKEMEAAMRLALSQAEKERQEAEAFQKDLRRKCEVEEQRALAELRELMGSTEVQVNEILEQARKQAEAYSAREAERLKQEVRDKLRATRSFIKKDREKESAQRSDFKLSIGDAVEMPGLNKRGILREIKGSDATVQVGNMRVSVKLNSLVPDNSTVGSANGARRYARNIGMEKARSMNIELDLRGLMVDEALDVAEKYIDDAYLAGLGLVYLIHGKGTGALRNAIRETLKGHRLVAGFSPAAYNEGGDGVTVVRLKVN